jgi:hypothetical protein
MGRQLEKASAGKAVLETFPHAAHATSYITDPIRYWQIATEFMDHCREKWKENK